MSGLRRPACLLCGDPAPFGRLFCLACPLPSTLKARADEALADAKLKRGPP